MAEIPTLPPESALRTRVAQHLSSRKEAIVRDWINAMASDPEIPSADQLTFSALEDHLPELLQELAAAIQHGGEIEKNAIKSTSAAHGKARWRSGYRLDEVLRELNRIREMIIQEIHDLLAADAGKEFESITSEAERFFRLVAATSAIQFSTAQDGELLLRNRQLEHAYEQVQAASEEVKNVAESRLRLLRAITHVLRNSLQPVMLAATNLKDLSRWDSEANEPLMRSATRLQSLLSTVTELSSLLAGELVLRIEKFRLPDLLESIDRKHRRRAEKKGLRFESELQSQITDVTSDLTKITTIADELIHNAIKFTDSGFVRVEISDSEKDLWILRVTDSGIGLDPDLARHVFGEIHHQPELPNAGARLGLVVSRHLARLLQGELTFISTYQKGSAFQLILPRETAMDS